MKVRISDVLEDLHLEDAKETPNLVVIIIVEVYIFHCILSVILGQRNARNVVQGQKRKPLHNLGISHQASVNTHGPLLKL